MNEAVEAFRAIRTHILLRIRVQMTLPATMAVGFSHAVMSAAIVVIAAAFAGSQYLGQEQLKAFAGSELGNNFALGINASLMALIFNRIILRFAAARKRVLGIDR